jgi:hypothetical protein
MSVSSGKAIEWLTETGAATLSLIRQVKKSR